jgi:hypothetical protein
MTWEGAWSRLTYQRRVTSTFPQNQPQSDGSATMLVDARARATYVEKKEQCGTLNQ